MVIEYKNKKLKISSKAFTKLVKLGTWWEGVFMFDTLINDSGWYRRQWVAHGT